MKDTLLFIFMLIGIFLQTSAKPAGWGVSLYKPDNDVAFNKQGSEWSISLVMLLGEIITYGFIPFWIVFLKSIFVTVSLAIKCTVFFILGLSVSYLVRYYVRLTLKI